MSEAKFTKGKWKALIKPVDAKPFTIFQDILINADGRDIAMVFLSSDDPEWLKDREQAIHDARLIESAPAMYEMLEFLLFNDSINDSSIDREVAQLLAKVRG